MIVLLVVAASIPAWAADSCPLQLDEARIQVKLAGESREGIEARLAQAIRANGELGRAFDTLSQENMKLKAEIDALKKSKEEGK
jgi:cell division protein FtsB